MKKTITILLLLCSVWAWGQNYHRNVIKDGYPIGKDDTIKPKGYKTTEEIKRTGTLTIDNSDNLKKNSDIMVIESTGLKSSPYRFRDVMEYVIRVEVKDTIETAYNIRAGEYTYSGMYLEIPKIKDSIGVDSVRIERLYYVENGKKMYIKGSNILYLLNDGTEMRRYKHGRKGRDLRSFAR